MRRGGMPASLPSGEAARAFCLVGAHLVYAHRGSANSNTSATERQGWHFFQTEMSYRYDHYAVNTFR